MTKVEPLLELIANINGTLQSLPNDVSLAPLAHGSLSVIEKLLPAAIGDAEKLENIIAAGHRLAGNVACVKIQAHCSPEASQLCDDTEELGCLLEFARRDAIQNHHRYEKARSNT